MSKIQQPLNSEGKAGVPSQKAKLSQPSGMEDSAEDRRLKGLRIGWLLATKRKKAKNQKICEECGCNFIRRGRREARCCSMECIAKYRRGKSVKKRNGGFVICDNRVFLFCGGTYIQRSILLMERKIGRPLRNGEHVHHIDGNTMNDKPSNLKLLTASVHLRLHANSKPRANGMFRKLEKIPRFYL